MWIPLPADSPVVATATVEAIELGYASLLDAIDDLRRMMTLTQVAATLSINYATMHHWLTQPPPAKYAPPPAVFVVQDDDRACYDSPWRDWADDAPKPTVWLAPRTCGLGRAYEDVIRGPGARYYVTGGQS